MNNKKSVIIISISSDIGTAMAHRWLSCGWNVYGTYRTYSNALDKLKNKDCKLVRCDLADVDSIRESCTQLGKMFQDWDILVLAPGTQEPIGSFLQCDFDIWESSVKTNFSSQLRIVHELLPKRNMAISLGSCVLFFAGGGTNNATQNYSAYTISKIALIKMCELLDSEIPDTRFTIVGPGWVKTKIHEATLLARNKAGSNYVKTIEKLKSDECTPMEHVLNCCDWIINSPREIVGGRNFSVVFDKWGSNELINMLKDNPDIYKLRRFGNDILTK